MKVKHNMEIGDLVRLSEYGIKRDYNNTLVWEDSRQLGVITAVFLGDYPYRVHWMKSHTRRILVTSHSRKELKYAV